ncbi:MAG: glycosyltransferase [Candidatus Bathyarchaeota archaeon]|nr:glycosyltransferase [Candidatus Bathyarchaeum sp.]
MDIILVCDVMMDFEGSIRPTMCLATELTRRGCTVSMISPLMSDTVEDYLNQNSIMPINLRAKLFSKNLGLSLLWFETWAREAFLKLNSRSIDNNSSITINFSQVISVPASAWYLQGPPYIALKDLEAELSAGFRVAYNFLRPAIDYADKRLINRMNKSSLLTIANSKFCASMYSKLGLRVSNVICPPIDCQIFTPSTSKPTSDYILTYFGKETKFSTVKKIADKGIKVKAFGSKLPNLHRGITRHHNIDFLGHISTEELVDAYSNAVFTIFPFTHEPFGYVPLESMACGTPVLTYNLQGPMEYVIDKGTGWLAQTDDELVQIAVDLWKETYPQHMRSACVNEASKFDTKFYVEKWQKILDVLCNRSLALHPTDTNQTGVTKS